MKRFFYSILFYCISPILVIRLLILSRKQIAYRKRIYERFGFVKEIPSKLPVIWVHSVSVGETMASIPLVREMIGQYPEYCFLVTTTTPTGSDQVLSIYGNTVEHCYMPYDLPIVLSVFLKRVHPILAVIMETELWPNVLHACYCKNIPVVIANARLSKVSAKSYSNFFVKSLVKEMLNKITVVACQNKEDGERFLKLGLEPNKLHITGSIKFDLFLEEETKKKGIALKKKWEKEFGRKMKVWIAGSTHEGEEDIVVEAFKAVRNIHKNCLLLLVPRHLHRFEQVYRGLINKNLSVIRYSQQEKILDGKSEIILGDTIGDLLLFYAASDVAFVGGSLVDLGGHNVLEAAALGLPVVCGPYVRNFQVICQELQRVGGLKIIHDERELTHTVNYWMQNSDFARKAGKSGLIFVEANKGALYRLLHLIKRLVDVNRLLF